MYGPVQLEWKGEDVKFTQITRTADLVHNGELGLPLKSRLKISPENILVIIHLWPMRGDLDKKTFVCWNDYYTYVKISLLQKFVQCKFVSSCNIVVPQMLKYCGLAKQLHLKYSNTPVLQYGCTPNTPDRTNGTLVTNQRTTSASQWKNNDAV